MAKGRKGRKRILKGRIVRNTEIAPGFFVMDVDVPWLGENARPGQFVLVKVSDERSTDPLLRIPLGFHKARKGKISFLYRVVGQATTILSNRKKGDAVDILGPLGNGFDLSPLEKNKKITVIIVAGGHGIAPLYALAEKVLSLGNGVEFFAGYATASNVVCVKDLARMGSRVHVTTDDGTSGEKGVVTGAVERFLEDRVRMGRLVSRTGGEEPLYRIYACGPAPMTVAVARVSEKFGIPAQVTRDSYMACGIGACRGCAVETPEGVKLACKDGPVFDALFASSQETGVCE